MLLLRSALIFWLGLSAVAQAAPAVRDWTILVYAAGDEEEVQAGTKWALAQLEKIPSLRPGSPVAIVAQHDDVGDDPNYRYVFHYGGKTIVPEEEIRKIDPAFRYGEKDSGDPRTLKEFIRWGVKAFPARHYALMLGGHSWGQQGLMQDFFVAGKQLERSTLIKNYELRRLLEELYREKGLSLSEGRIDLLIVDACTWGQLDILLDFKDLFHYIAAATVETPFVSFPNASILDRFISAVGAHPNANAAKTLENEWLKPMVREYVKSHARGGSLVGDEKQIDAVEFFALRTARLGAVGDALRNLVSELPEEAFTDWRDGNMPTVDAIADTDSNADLLALARGFDSYIAEKLTHMVDETWRAEKWKAARVRVAALATALGHRGDAWNYDATHVHHAVAEGAWANIQIDETAADRELVLCSALKSFAMMNAGAPALLPRFFGAKEKQISARDLNCGDLAHDKKKRRKLVFKDDVAPIGNVLGVRVAWPHGVPAHLRELGGERYLLVWLPRDRKPLSLRVRFAATGTTRVVLEYIGGDPQKYLHGQEIGEPEAVEKTAWSVVEDPDGPGGLYVSEGHSIGTHFKNGLGIFLGRALDPEEPYQGGRMPLELVETKPFSLTLEEYFADLERRGKMHEHAVKGTDFYRLHAVSATLWPDFLFGRKAK